MAMTFHDFFNVPWERARGLLREELEQMQLELKSKWGAAFTREGIVRVVALPSIDLEDGVTGELPFSSLPDIDAGTVLGRREGSSGEVEPLTLSGLEVVGTVLTVLSSADHVVMSDGGNPPTPMDDGNGNFLYVDYTP